MQTDDRRHGFDHSSSRARHDDLHCHIVAAGDWATVQLTPILFNPYGHSTAKALPTIIGVCIRITRFRSR